jgi:chromosome segregation ATPase
MIATGLTFLFGFLSALLVALLLAPLAMGRARRFARREFEASIPVSANEIRASFDHVRAEAALTARRREMDAQAMRDKAALERADAGRVARENAELKRRNRELEETIAAREAELKDLTETLEAREAEYGRLESELRETTHDLDLRIEEMDALAERFRELTQIADERKIAIVALESKTERLSDELRQADWVDRERQATIERLRGEAGALEARFQKEKATARKLDDRVSRLTAELADRDEKIVRLAQVVEASLDEPALLADVAAAPDPEVSDAAAAVDADTGESESKAVPSTGSVGERVRQALDLPEHPLDEADLDEARLRQRIDDIAARVIHLTASVEGRGSPIDRILDADADAGGADGGDRPTLAQRARRLRENDADHAAE